MGFFTESLVGIFEVRNFPKWNKKTETMGKETRLFRAELPFPEVLSSLKEEDATIPMKGLVVDSPYYMFIKNAKRKVPKGFTGDESEMLFRKLRKAMQGDDDELDNLVGTINGRRGQTMPISSEVFIRLKVVYQSPGTFELRGRKVPMRPEWMWKIHYDFVKDAKAYSLKTLPLDENVVEPVDVTETGLKAGIETAETWVAQSFYDDDPRNPTVKLTEINRRLAEEAKEAQALLGKMQRIAGKKPLAKPIEIDTEDEIDESKVMPLAARMSRQRQNRQIKNALKDLGI